MVGCRLRFPGGTEKFNAAANRLIVFCELADRFYKDGMIFYRVLFSALLTLSMLGSPSAIWAITSTPKKPSAKQAKSALTKTPAAKARFTAPQKRLTAGAALKKVLVAPRSRFRQRNSPYAGFWTVPNFADATSGDVIDGEDLTVRRAAVEALNGINGSIVVADPSTGRILSMVNQKLVLQNGFQPCSTVKLLAGVAGVMEGEYSRDKMVKLGRGSYMDMTQAIAHSNNPYFASIGRKLGYEKVSGYAKLLGFGETAGLNIPGEQPGIWPDKEVPSGIGMMTSFGDGINLTPLPLGTSLSGQMPGCSPGMLRPAVSPKPSSLA